MASVSNAQFSVWCYYSELKHAVYSKSIGIGKNGVTTTLSFIPNQEERRKFEFHGENGAEYWVTHLNPPPSSSNSE